MKPNYHVGCDETWSGFGLTNGCSRPNILYGLGRCERNSGRRRRGNHERVKKAYYVPNAPGAVNQDVVKFLRYRKTTDKGEVSWRNSTYSAKWREVVWGVAAHSRIPLLPSYVWRAQCWRIITRHLYWPTPQVSSIQWVSRVRFIVFLDPPAVEGTRMPLLLLKNLR